MGDDGIRTIGWTDTNCRIEIKPYTIPATMQECEDALYEKAKSLPHGPAKKGLKPSEEQKRIIRDFFDTREHKAMANLFGIDKTTLLKWKRELDLEDS